MTAVVSVLNFVKLRDLAKDNVSNNKKLCRVCGIRVTKKGVVFFLFKCVLASFWFQYLLYFIVVFFQMAFDVFDVDKKFAGEDVQRAISVLKKVGQCAFMALISGYLWLKLFDDDKCIMGTKTDEAKKTPQSGLQSSLSYDRMSASDQSSLEELSFSSSSVYSTASGSSTDEARPTTQRP